MRDQATAKELEEFARDIAKTVKVVGESDEMTKKRVDLQGISAFHAGCGIPVEKFEDQDAGEIEEVDTCDVPVHGDPESVKRYLDKMFMKMDGAKPPLAILFDTSNALEGVARVMAFGAEKYDRKNWAKVDDTERYISAALRHIAAHCSGERFDQESGLDHLDHAITSLLFVSELIKRD